MLKLIAESCTGIMKHFPAHKLKQKKTTIKGRQCFYARWCGGRGAGASDLLRRPRTIQKCTFSVQTVPTSWWSRRAPSASDLPATHVLTSKTSTERYELPYFGSDSATLQICLIFKLCVCATIRCPRASILD